MKKIKTQNIDKTTLSLMINQMMMIILIPRREEEVRVNSERNLSLMKMSLSWQLTMELKKIKRKRNPAKPTLVTLVDSSVRCLAVATHKREVIHFKRKTKNRNKKQEEDQSISLD